jgi:hypothetical protein
MTKDPVHPKWWKLYLTIGSVSGLFWLVARAPLSETVRTLFEAGLVIILCCLMNAWLEANQVALVMEAAQKNRKKAILDVPVTRQSILRNTVAVEENRNGISLEPENRRERSISPAWLIALAVIVVDFFKSQG